MPKGPRGEKRPGDVIGAAIMVARIATGEIADNATPADKAHHTLLDEAESAIPGWEDR